LNNSGKAAKNTGDPLNSDWFERASPRIILAAKQLCAALAESH
jgi:hypothetical protein